MARAYRRATRPDDLDEVNARHAERHLTWHRDDDGSLVVQGRLSPEDGAVVVKALEAAADVRSAERKSGSAEPPLPKEGADGWGARNADALATMAETLLATGPTAQPGGERYQVVVHADAETLAGHNDGDYSDGDCCEIDDGPAIAAETARRLSCDASLVAMIEADGEPLNVGRKTRSIPPAIRRALRSRDGGCRFPSCTNRRFVDGHHVRHWGETSLDNLVELCRRHHRLATKAGSVSSETTTPMADSSSDVRTAGQFPHHRRRTPCPAATRWFRGTAIST